MGLLYFLIWLVVGAMLGAFLLAKFKIPPIDTGYRNEPNWLFWWCIVGCAFIWPLVLALTIVIWPALWVYRKTAKPETPSK